MKSLSAIVICSLLPLSATGNDQACENAYTLENNMFTCTTESSTEIASLKTDSPRTESFSQSLIGSVVKYGRRYEFIDEGEGIGIAEVAPLGSTSLFEQLEDYDEYSALEVYLTLTGDDKEIPSKLLDDHSKFIKKTDRSDSKPKTLNLDISSGALSLSTVDEGYDPSYCNYSEYQHPGNSQFTWAWFWGIGTNKDFTAQQTYFPSNLNGTTGKRWYAGKSRARWLGACNGNYIYGFPAFEFRAEYKNYLGQWSTAFVTQVEPYFWVRYSSFSSPEQWRVRLKEISYNVNLNREYAVAVAGNDPLGFEIGF